MRKCRSEPGFDTLSSWELSVWVVMRGAHICTVSAFRVGIGEQCAVTREDRYIKWAILSRVVESMLALWVMQEDSQA